MPEGLFKGVGGFYSVLGKEDGSIYTCTVSGIHRMQGGATLVGDAVTFNILDSESKEGHIDQILTEKIPLSGHLVSNIDRLAVVIAVKNPLPDLMLVDKLIITSVAKGIEPMIIINKVDLDEDLQADKLKKIYKNTGFTILALSKITRKVMMSCTELSGNTTAFAGQSGVGKSTILNAVLDNWVMETGK